MLSTMDATTTGPISPKTMSPPGMPLLSDVVSSDEDHEGEIRDANGNGARSGKETDRQAPANGCDTFRVPESQHYWSCMTGMFTIPEEYDDPLVWCGAPLKADYTKVETAKTKSAPNSPTSTTALVLDEHNTTGQLEDGDSIHTNLTVGKKPFGDDLSSLASVGDSRILLREEFDDNSTIASVGNLSDIVIPDVSNETPTDDDETWDTSSQTNSITDSILDEKLKAFDADKTIGDSKMSTVQMIRNSSSMTEASSRLGKKKRKNDANKENDESAAKKSQPALKTQKLLAKKSPLVKDLRNKINTYGRYDVRCAHLTCTLGDLYEEDKDYQQALKLYRDASNIYTTKLGDHHDVTVETKVRTGKLLEKMGDYDKAIAMYFNALSMRKAVKGEADVSVPDTLSFISRALKKKGRFEQAVKEMKRALKLYRGCLGDSHPRVTSAVDEISSLYIAVGDFGKASAILEEVVKLKASTKKSNHMDVGGTLLELATAYELGKERQRALRSLKKAYAIFVEIEGDAGHQCIQTLERIANIYKGLKDYDKSVAAYLGVLRARKEKLGPSHAIVADTYLHLGVTLRESGQLDKAMRCMKQSLSIYVGEGKDMHDVGMIAELMHEMAVIHKAKGQTHESLKILKQELTIRKKMGEREQHQVAVTLHHIGRTEYELRNYNKALNNFLEAMTAFEKSGEEAGMDFAETVFSTGQVFEAMRHIDKAKEAYDECLKIFRVQAPKRVSAIMLKMEKLKRVPGKTLRKGKS